jgi:hypothetical protein
MSMCFGPEYIIHRPMALNITIVSFIDRDQVLWKRTADVKFSARPAYHTANSQDRLNQMM